MHGVAWTGGAVSSAEWKSLAAIREKSLGKSLRRISPSPSSLIDFKSRALSLSSLKANNF